MTKLTELEKQKVITCVYYVKKSIECDRCKLENEYDKLGHYDEAYDQKLEHKKEMEEFYSIIIEKLKEIL